MLTLACKNKSRKCKCIRCVVTLLLALSVTVMLFFWSEEILLPGINNVNRYYATTVSPGFEIKPPFSFPQPNSIKSVEEISRTDWIHRLADILEKRKHKVIYLLACDSHAYASLLNWLVSAYVNTEIDIEDILVLSLDEKIYRILIERDISTVYIETEEFIKYHYFLSWRTEQDQFHSMIRMALARLISHWGFDVAVFDVDAIPLKDPIGLYKMFSDSDIISSYALNGDLSSTNWCMSLGFAFFKSNRMVEFLWEYSSNVTEKRWRIEQKLNHVINIHLGATWSLESRRIKTCKHMSHLCDATGITRTGLRITLLSRWAVCRYCGITRMEDYYIWHKQGLTRSQADRRFAAEAGSVWFLRDDWEQIDKKSTYTREHWIHEITDSI